MKSLMATAAAVVLLAGLSAANAQNAPAGSSQKSDQVDRPTANKPLANKKMHRRETTGAGGGNGIQYDPSIHQSRERDSRGTPKGPGPDYEK
jgi:hypothetical protein